MFKSFPILMLLTIAGGACKIQAQNLSWCGADEALTGIGPNRDPIRISVVFVAFLEDSNPVLPSWTNDLVNDVPQFFETMSGSREDGIPFNRVHMSIIKRPGADSTLAWVFPDSASKYLNRTVVGKRTASVNSWILHQIENQLDPNPSQPTYWSSRADIVCMVYYRVTADLVNESGPQQYDGTNKITLEATPVVLSWPTDQPGTETQMESHGITDKNAAEEVMAHECFHLIGPSHPPLVTHYGRYDLMSEARDNGIAVEEGLLPPNPIELTKALVEWGPLPETISGSRLNIPVPDFFGHAKRSERKTYRVIVPYYLNGYTQYFYLVNHQGQTPYDEKYDGHGLLIWHAIIDPSGTTVVRDLELASGKFSGSTPDPIYGKDRLEVFVPPYLGSATDFFSGSPIGNFSYLTNPNSNGYEGKTVCNAGGCYEVFSDSLPQSIPTNFTAENIRYDFTTRDMIVDVYTSHAQLFEPENVGNGGSIQRGSTVLVQWRVRPLLGATTVDLQMSEDGGSNYRYLAMGLANSGSFNWPVLQKAGTNYKLRLITHGPGGPLDLGVDTSDSTIVITDNRSCPP